MRLSTREMEVAILERDFRRNQPLRRETRGGERFMSLELKQP
jgi:hypothetical protein